MINGEMNIHEYFTIELAQFHSVRWISHKTKENEISFTKGLNSFLFPGKVTKQESI